MSKYVPLISSGIAGPLGALHLPRLWQKVSLQVAEKLADGYPALAKGYDSMTCDALGLDADALLAFVKANRPTYPQFEAWVRSHGTRLTKADIHRHNLAIEGYCHTEEVRKNILAANGIPDDGSVLPGAIDLNNLDDWFEFHQSVLR